MTTRDPLDDLIDASARTLELPLNPAWKPAVTTNLETSLNYAALVTEFELPDAVEPAPVFRA